MSTLNEAQWKAKEYVDEHRIEKIVSEMINTLVHTKDKKPLIFMVSWFDNKIKYISNLVTKEELAQNGIQVEGPFPQKVPLMNYPEFDGDCHSLLKKCLNKEIWSWMKKRATHLGGKIQLCI